MYSGKQFEAKILATAEADFNEVEKADLGHLTAQISAMCEVHEKPLNDIERNAVLGMISYIAYTQNVGEAFVGDILTSHYGVNTVEALPSRLYQDAIEYLVDLKTDKVVN